MYKVLSFYSPERRHRIKPTIASILFGKHVYTIITITPANIAVHPPNCSDKVAMKSSTNSVEENSKVTLICWMTASLGFIHLNAKKCK